MGAHDPRGLLGLPVPVKEKELLDPEIPGLDDLQPVCPDLPLPQLLHAGGQHLGRPELQDHLRVPRGQRLLLHLPLRGAERLPAPERLPGILHVPQNIPRNLLLLHITYA